MLLVGTLRSERSDKTQPDSEGGKIAKSRRKPPTGIYCRGLGDASKWLVPAYSDEQFLEDATILWSSINLASKKLSLFDNPIKYLKFIIAFCADINFLTFQKRKKK